MSNNSSLLSLMTAYVAGFNDLNADWETISEQLDAEASVMLTDDQFNGWVLWTEKVISRI